MKRLSSLYKSRMMKCGNQYNHGYITHTGKGVYLIRQIILWHYRNDDRCEGMLLHAPYFINCFSTILYM